MDTSQRSLKVTTEVGYTRREQSFSDTVKACALLQANKRFPELMDERKSRTGHWLSGVNLQWSALLAV